MDHVHQPDRPRPLRRRTRPARRVLTGLAATVVAASLAACSVGASTPDTTAADGTPTKVTLVTHDSFVMPKKLQRQFEQESGYTLRIVNNGDAGELTNKLVLTKDNPLGDVVFGIDNSFASRAVDAGVLAPYTSSAAPASAADYALDDATGASELTPVDWGDVCVNVDDVWFADHDLAPPTSFDDLLDPAYQDLFVTPAASTSSPGFAFLLATIGTFGKDGWQDYWTSLMANGARVVSGWSDAYEVDFTAGGGNGDRPIVLQLQLLAAVHHPRRQEQADHQRAAGHLLPPGGVRRGARRCRQRPGGRGARGLLGGHRVPDLPARQHVRLPRRRRRSAPGPVGEVGRPSPTPSPSPGGDHHLAQRLDPGVE